MTAFPHKDLTDPIIDNAENIFVELCQENEKENGDYHFTFRQFLHRAMKYHQALYARILERSREYNEEDEHAYIFNEAHRAIGQALYWHMQREGWERTVIPGADLNIFLEKAERIIYRPPQ